MIFSQKTFLQNFKHKKELLVYLQFRHCFRLYFGLWFFAILFLQYLSYRLDTIFHDLFVGMSLLETIGVLMFHSFVFSLFKALISAFIDLQFQKWLLYRKSLVFVFCARLIIHLIVLAIVIKSCLFLFADIGIDAVQFEAYLYNHAKIDVMVLYSIFVAHFASFMLEMDRRLGAGNLRKLAKGKFYRPSEDYRVFMFIDLESSTTIAEKLGHVDFSRLLQDCFSDFSVVGKYGAEVYQHVGDEVVVSWEAQNNCCYENVIDSFFAFEEILEKRKKYYLNKYNVFPKFRAGAHIGKVTVAEVGELKREICYHGDTLNTTARILALGKKYDSSLLISGTLMAEIKNKTQNYNSQKIGEFMLKGKMQEVTVFSITKKTSIRILNPTACLFFLLCLVSCKIPSENTSELPKPSQEFVLPAELNEISGLCFVDENTIASVQDENGIIYLININSGAVTQKIPFAENGDYEGITLVNDTYFILRSDGNIYEVRPDGKTKKHKFKDSKGFNFEGLCYDKTNHRLLLACKEHSEKKYKKEVLIYSFDLEKMKHDEDVAFKLKQKDLDKNFKPSGITIYENQIYLLSFKAQKLAVLSSEGELKKQFYLPPSTFAQPEGITFDTNGNLYISNEINGHFSTANLLKFKNIAN